MKPMRILWQNCIRRMRTVDQLSKDVRCDVKDQNVTYIQACCMHINSLKILIDMFALSSEKL